MHEVIPKGILNAAITSSIFLAYDVTKNDNPIGIASKAVQSRRLQRFNTQLAIGAKMHIIAIGIEPTHAVKQRNKM